MSKGKESSYIFKVLLIGEAAVGKTSLTLKFVHGKFKSDYLLTVGMEPYSKYITVGNNTVTLSIWDIAGQQRFDVFRTMFFRGAKAALLVFDLTRPATLSKLQNWYEDLIKNAGKDVLTILVGNKNDLEDLRSVSNKEAIAFAKKIKALTYIETSAKTGENVDESFKMITEKLVERAQGM
ncbi:MAG TPA: Rab family GTPase [candidate division Zixibacteria bacterium]|nr:Rab family GTPase [candidate division Zixibacteria bacterium]HUU88043.1 Rab family GTPase [Candidatus Glassbacteria bacterium]